MACPIIIYFKVRLVSIPIIPDHVLYLFCLSYVLTKITCVMDFFKKTIESNCCG